MKEQINKIMILFACLPFFLACETVNDNPVALTPDTFVLNTPAYSSIVTDLKQSSILALTCSQPEYGFTAATTYTVQVSVNNTWNAGTEEIPATFDVLEPSFSTAKLHANATDLARSIVKLSGWKSEEEFVGEPMDIYIRLSASIAPSIPAIYSNSVKIKILPFYIELTDALPATYYLVGACIGDGTWTNTKAGIGVSLIPLSLIENQEYDKVSGKGIFTHTGFFPAGKGFKLIGIPGSWDEQWGLTDGAFAHNDSGSGNITVAADGWYTVTLNTIKNEMEVKAANVNSTGFAAMELVGTFEGWGATPVSMTKTDGENSHVWYADITFDADADISGSDPEGCKFRTDNSWSNNWGGKNFPYSVTSGSNIPYKAGTYRVVFNDLDKCYFFFINE